jgi:hypothetical protein
MPKTRQVSDTFLDSARVFQHGKASVVDDLCWCHGDGLLGFVVETTESIAVTHHVVDMQRHPVDR